MRLVNRHSTYLVFAAALTACDGGTTPEQGLPDPGAPPGTAVGAPITTFTTAATGSCPAPRAKSVLVDPSHDGGVWWFPQAASTPAGFNPDSAHQGRALANYLRAEGYTVTELGRGATLSTDSMRTYATVIRAGYYYDSRHPGYSAGDIAAYRAFLACPRTLVLLAEYLRDGRRDDLADSLGIPLTGIITSTITDFASHALTVDVESVPFMAGSWLASGATPDAQVLGRLPTGEAVMGVLASGPARIFFIGDANGIQQVPQPLVKNLVTWGLQ